MLSWHWWTDSLWEFESIYIYIYIKLPLSLAIACDYSLTNDNLTIPISIYGGIIIKIFSYDRRDYESVNEKTYLRLCPEKRRKKEFGP